jgi:hypothetical protein
MQNYRYEYLSIAKTFLKYIQCKLFDVVQFDNCKSVYTVVWRLFDVPKGTVYKYLVLYSYFCDALMKAMNYIRNSFKIVKYK